MLENFIEVYKTPNTEDLYNHLKDSIKHKGEWRDNTANITGYQNMSVTLPSDKTYEDIVGMWGLEIAQQYAKKYGFVITAGTRPRFNTYDIHDHMEEHIDHIHSCFDGKLKGIPILSIVGGINSDYQGGEFVFKFSTPKTYKINAGEALIFPSVFPWKHQVNPITQGTRYSWVVWCW